MTGPMCTTPTGAMEALTGLTPMDLVIQSKARSAAHSPWSLRYWSYLQPSRGHTSILMWLYRSDPIFNKAFGIMKPTFNLEPKYRVTVLTREEWIRGPGTPSVVKGLIWFTYGSRTIEENGTRVHGQSLGRRLSICLRNMLQFFRLKYMLFWFVSMKFKWKL